MISFLKTEARSGRRFQFLGAPYDGGASFRSGARFGPEAIRAASRLLCDGSHPTFSVDPRALVSDGGDLCQPTSNPACLDRDILTGIVAADGIPLVAGGDHAITLPALKAFARRIGGPFAVVHFDAHCDTWPDNFTAASGHGTWVREAVEQGVVAASNVFSIGMRGPVDHAVRDWLGAQGGHSYPAEAWFGHSRTIVTALPVWLTVDIDVLDPAHAPGTGTPEVGGFTTRELLGLIREFASKLDVQGMDVVEVSPPYDQSEITALAAATVMWEFIAARETALRP